MTYRSFLLLFSGILFFSFPPPSFAAMNPIPKIRVGIPPTEVLKEAIRNEPNRLANQQKGNDFAPLITWLVEPDEQFSPSLILAKSDYRVFTVTSIAAQLMPVIATVDYGVEELLTPLLLITGSTKGRFVRMFLEGYEDKDIAMRQTLDHLYPALQDFVAAANEAGEIPREAFMAALEKNIDFQVAEAVNRYRQRIDNGRLVVAGAVIDMTDAYGMGAGRLIIINVNGETAPKKMRLMREVATIGQEAAGRLGLRFADTLKEEQKDASTPEQKPASK